MIIKNLCFFFFILILSACQKKLNIKNNENEVIENKLDNIQQKKVVLIGTSDDPKSLNRLIILNSSYLFGTNHKYARFNIFNDTLNIELDSIEQYQLLEIWVSGDTIGSYTRIFVSPGDTLTFKIKNYNIQFTGINAAYHNFFNALEKKTIDYSDNPYKGNIDQYKAAIKNIFNEKVLFFDKFIKKHNIQSIEYIKLVKDILKFEYLNNLIQPRSIKSRSFDYYYNTQLGVLATIDKEFSKREDLFDISSYLDNVSIEDFKRPELLANSILFKDALDSFIRFYFVQNEFLPYSAEAFIAEKEFIQKNFDDELQNYAIARMIREYNVNGFGYSKSNIGLIKGLIDEYREKFTRPSYKEKMAEIEESLDNFNFKLSQDALFSKLINPMGDTTNLGEIYKKTTNKIKVIDFWASWCPPCITEIKNAKYFKNKLANKDNVEWIYISIDRDHENWLKTSLELQEYFNTENQYYLLGGKNSSLGKSLKVSGIPRYVIFDKKEKIILDNAPRPSDSLVFKKIIDKINLEN